MNKQNSYPQTKYKNEKILLALLPFWTPLIPPLGISCLKSYLQGYGYEVKTVDANVEKGLKEFYDGYFDILRQFVPEDKRGNFYSIGHDVLRNHMMAYFNRRDREDIGENTGEDTGYMELVKILIYKTFYLEVPDRLAVRLNDVIHGFFIGFEAYFLDLLEKEKPAVLGLSVYSGTLAASLLAAKLAREKYPDLKILVGGGVFADQLALNTPNMDYFLERTKTWIDKIIIGEGEVLFREYLQGRLPGSQRIYTLDDIKWQLLDLSAVDVPDFSDLDPLDYTNLAAYTSRSCPFQCSFCSETLQWGKYRKKKSAQIVEELIALHKQHGSRVFFMSDSLLNPIITDLAREFTKAEIPLYWDGCIRADKDACHTENSLLWRRGGFYRARLGMESGSQRVLDLMGKKITVEQIKNTLISLAHAGIKTSTLWVIGHPGETEEDFQQTLDLVEEFKDYIYDVEGTPFWYHLSGQPGSLHWSGHGRAVLLYPEKFGNLLGVQTWTLDGEPSREETYRRQNRFTRHLRNLGIPNPYSLHDIHRADERWKKLHRNAVPSLLKLKDGDNDMYEARNVKEIKTVSSTMQEDGKWGF